MSGWIGVDLDGTLAVYKSWDGGKIGDPVPAMVERVKGWLAEGKTVKIFTARVSISGGYSLESQQHADQAFVDEQRALIEAWCEKHIGQKLEITNVKDFSMIELWDDRAVQVQMNTDQRLGVLDPAVGNPVFFEHDLVKLLQELDEIKEPLPPTAFDQKSAPYK